MKRRPGLAWGEWICLLAIIAIVGAILWPVFQQGRKKYLAARGKAPTATTAPVAP
jgi:hypothetical protein